MVDRSQGMHVAHLMFSYNLGGKERVLTDVIAARAGSDVRYGVIVVNDSYDESLIQRLRAAGADVLLLRRRAGGGSPRFLLDLIGYLRRNRTRVLHIREPDAIPLALAAKAAIPSLKLVASVHNTRLMERVATWKIQALRRLFARVVVISKAVRGECARRGLHHVVVMNNAIDVARFAAVPRHRRDGPLWLICVARYLIRQKAQDVLIEAVARCAARGLDVRCRLLGNLDGRNEEDYRQLVDLAAALGISDRIEFVVNRSDVHTYLGRSDVFVLPSRFEGLGNVVLEAMAAGVPVIASAVDGLCELVTDGENGVLVPPGDADALSDAIARAYADPEAFEQLGQAGRQFVTAFDIGRYAERYETLYREVAA